MFKSPIKYAFGAVAFPSLGGFIMGVYYRPQNNNWYRELNKPDWTPPNAIFGPAWFLLYSGMGFASYLVWKDGGGFQGKAGFALYAYGIQLALNWSWSPVFFGTHSPKLALVDLGALVIAVSITTVAFYKVNTTAGLILLPYLAWLGLVGALNYAIIVLNPE